MVNKDSRHFKLFAKSLELALEKYVPDTTQTLLESQRDQIRTLIKLENQLRRTLIKHPWGPSVYKKFIDFICDSKRNILAARPYFRERQTVFTATISGALKKRNFKTLYKFRVNYTFILFALKQFKWPKGGKIQKIAGEIEKLRNQICEQFMPLAISQARIFYASTPKSHLSWMDLVQIHCGGLLVAVDKFVPPDTSNMTDDESLQAYRKFRAVAIGRMISDRIESFSETVLHFYPVDRKKIYRANKIIRHFGDKVDYVKLADMVNVDIEQESQRTNPREIADLLASASCVSGDSVPVFEGFRDGEPAETTLQRYSDSKEDRYDATVETNDAMVNMKLAIKELPPLHKKILIMKGIYDNSNSNVHDESFSGRGTFTAQKH